MRQRCRSGRRGSRGARWAARLLLWVTLVLVLPAAEEAADLTAAVRQLGSGEYAAREAAERTLRAAGWQALPVLEAAAQDADPEISSRAHAMLADARLGILPDWPPATVAQVRGYARLADDAAREQCLAQVADVLAARAVPFLLVVMADGNERLATAAERSWLKLDAQTRAQATLAAVRSPRGSWQTRAMARALTTAGRYAEALKLLRPPAGGAPVPPGPDQPLVEEVLRAARQGLVQQVNAGQLPAAKSATEALVALLPAALPFACVQAEILARQGHEADATKLWQAIAQTPADDLDQLALASDLLHAWRRDDEAEPLWRRLLAAPTARRSQRMNALLRLAGLGEAHGEYAAAAELLEQLLAVQPASGEHGEGVVLAGDVRGAIARLRQQEAHRPEYLALTLSASVKEGKEGELRAARDQAAGLVQVTVEPHGLRLLDVAPADMAYDPADQSLYLQLNGQPAGPRQRVQFTPAHPTVMVTLLDCCYVYTADLATGDLTKGPRFEFDYAIRFAAGKRLDGLRDLRLTINGTTYPWADCRRGVKFDFLPPALTIVIDGTAPDGTPLHHEERQPLGNPSLNVLLPRPAKPPSAPATEAAPPAPAVSGPVP